MVDSGGAGGAVTGGEVGGGGGRNEAVPGKERAEGTESGVKACARGARAVEVAEEDAQVGPHAGTELVHELDLGKPIRV